MKTGSKLIVAIASILVAFSMLPNSVQAQKAKPIYCQNNGFAVLAAEIENAKKSGLPPALIDAAQRRYERARRWRMRARAAECEGLLRNALNDLRLAAAGKSAASTIGIKCDAPNLKRLSNAITKGREAKLNHALIRSVQSRYLISKKLLAQNKLESCPRQIATGLRTTKECPCGTGDKGQETGAWCSM